MGIRINKQVSIQSIESRFELTFKRERVDIAKLLKYLKQGHSIDSAFNYSKSIASSIRKMLVDERLIDTQDVVTPAGEEFINYPFKVETERGIYNLYLATVQFGLEKAMFVIRMERKLSNDERTQESANLGEIYVANEFSLGQNEVGVMEKVDNRSKSFCMAMPNESVVFDIVNGTYETSFGTFKMGEPILHIAKKYATKAIEENVSYFEYNSKKNSVVIKSLDDFKEEDLVNGVASKLTVSDVELVNVPFEINTVTVAKQYAYFYLYTKLEDGNYYTLDEMNEVFQNEVLSKNVIDESIKDSLLDFSFSMDGFEKNLSAEKYNKLSYRLKVMKTLLNIEAIKDSQGFSSAKNYAGVLKLLKEKVSPAEVDSLYMVMGYAFARNKKNNMVDCVKNFKQQYNSIVIVNKSGEGKVNEDQSIKDDISALGVHTINKSSIDTLFHDRYLIFELKDKTYKTFLVTCEIGSLFNMETNETKGTLFEIPNTEVVKNGKSLINMIKEDR